MLRGWAGNVRGQGFLWLCLVLLTCDGGPITFEGAGDKEQDSNYCAMLEEALLNPAAFDPQDPGRIVTWAQREYYIYCTNADGDPETDIAGDSTTR